MSSDNTSISKKIVVEGIIENTSPLIISSGEKGEEVDIVLLKDENGAPYIPATSLIGVLRHHFYKYYVSGLDEKEKEQVKFFWGASSDKVKNNEEENDIYQSSIIVKNLNTINFNNKIEIRDGVKIDNKTGMAQNKGKFDYEILPAGNRFNLKFTVVIRNEFDESFFLKVVKTLCEDIKKQRIKLGSMTTKGFGNIKFANNKYDCYRYDFSHADHFIRWIKDIPGSKEKLQNIKPFDKAQNDFIASIWLSLKTSLAVKSYSRNPEDPDSVHIQSNDKDIIPGTSIKGTIRSRAERITNTLGIDETYIHELMGYVYEDVDKDNNKKNQKKIKSRLYVEETVLNSDNIIKKIQSRIKIDRFTGGTIKTALFDIVPVYMKNIQSIEDKKDTDLIELRLKVEDCKDYEAGLMMLVIKDLWNSDLPVGGDKTIGRGIMQGQKMEIDYKDSRFKIFNDFSQNEGSIDIMEKWVESLLKKRSAWNE